MFLKNCLLHKRRNNRINFIWCLKTFKLKKTWVLNNQSFIYLRYFKNNNNIKTFFLCKIKAKKDYLKFKCLKCLSLKYSVKKRTELCHSTPFYKINIEFKSHRDLCWDSLNFSSFSKVTFLATIIYYHTVDSIVYIS